MKVIEFEHRNGDRVSYLPYGDLCLKTDLPRIGDEKGHLMYLREAFEEIEAYRNNEEYKELYDEYG